MGHSSPSTAGRGGYAGQQTSRLQKETRMKKFLNVQVFQTRKHRGGKRSSVRCRIHRHLDTRRSVLRASKVLPRQAGCPDPTEVASSTRQSAAPREALVASFGVVRTVWRRGRESSTVASILSCYCSGQRLRTRQQRGPHWLFGPVVSYSWSSLRLGQHCSRHDGYILSSRRLSSPWASVYL